MMEKGDGTTDWWAIIIWAVLICTVLIGVYKMGKQKSWNDLTPQQQREENANCRRWTGEDCQSYSTD